MQLQHTFVPMRRCTAPTSAIAACARAQTKFNKQANITIGPNKRAHTHAAHTLDGLHRSPRMLVRYSAGVLARVLSGGTQQGVLAGVLSRGTFRGTQQGHSAGVRPSVRLRVDLPDVAGGVRERRDGERHDAFGGERPCAMITVTTVNPA